MRCWQRSIRFLEFDSASQAHVIPSVKMTINRFRCTACGYVWTDYPDFRFAA
jgi:hypothetical protein